MAVKILNSEPDKSITKRVICYKCGCLLEYTPNDVRKEMNTDYTGCTDIERVIDCPSCSAMIPDSKGVSYES